MDDYHIHILSVIKSYKMSVRADKTDAVAFEYGSFFNLLSIKA